MKKIISMFLVFVMSFVFVSAIPSFAGEVPNFNLKEASIEDTIDRAEVEVLTSNDLDKKTKEQLVEKLREIKKKAKSNKHLSSVVWDKVKEALNIKSNKDDTKLVKEALKATGLLTAGAAIGGFVTYCLFSSQPTSALALKIDSYITSSSTLSACKRWLIKKVVDNDIIYSIKEDVVKLARFVF